MTMFILTLGFACIAVFLGFVALLKQKTYLDSATQQPVEVDVPILGKLKTNYPAIIFVFLGFALVFWAFEKAFPPRKVHWHLTGSFRHPEGKSVAWDAGTLTFDPADVHTEINGQGKFDIDVPVEEGKSLEDSFETLDFSHVAGSLQLPMKTELDKFRHGQRSQIATLTEHTISFKPLDITPYSSPEN